MNSTSYTAAYTTLTLHVAENTTELLTSLCSWNANFKHTLLFMNPFCYFYPKDYSQVRGCTMFCEKCFCFRPLKKSNASKFASSFFLQSVFHFHKNLTASASASLVWDDVWRRGCVRDDDRRECVSDYVRKRRLLMP